MNKRNKKKNKTKGPTPVILEPLEVKLEDTRGDVGKLIKKFSKKVRKEEVLKPYYNRLMYFTPKSQIRREKLRKAKYEEKKRIEKNKES